MDVAGAFQVTRVKVECCRDERFVKARRVNAKKFFTELRRRNVYKVAIAYAVVAWLLMQIATLVFPFLEIPNWAIRLVFIGVPINSLRSIHDFSSRSLSHNCTAFSTL